MHIFMGKLLLWGIKFRGQGAGFKGHGAGGRGQGAGYRRCPL